MTIHNDNGQENILKAALGATVQPVHLAFSAMDRVVVVIFDSNVQP
jgi:hypothetical protein